MRGVDNKLKEKGKKQQVKYEYTREPGPKGGTKRFFPVTTKGLAGAWGTGSIKLYYRRVWIKAHLLGKKVQRKIKTTPWREQKKTGSSEGRDSERS